MGCRTWRPKGCSHVGRCRVLKQGYRREGWTRPSGLAALWYSLSSFSKACSITRLAALSARREHRAGSRQRSGQFTQPSTVCVWMSGVCVCVCVTWFMILHRFTVDSHTRGSTPYTLQPLPLRIQMCVEGTLSSAIHLQATRGLCWAPRFSSGQNLPQRFAQ